MRNAFLAICICSMIFGFSVSVYAFPSMGDDCASCHGGGSSSGGGETTPGCGSSGGGGCNQRFISESPSTSELPPAARGQFETDVTEEDGFTVIHPKDMSEDLPVMVWDNPLRKQMRQRLIERLKKVASHGFAVVVPGEGKGQAECDNFMAGKNSDPKSKFFEKFDLDDVNPIPGE